MTIETFKIARGKIVITTYGATGTGTNYPANHITLGIRDARANLATIESSKLGLKPSTIARRDVLRKAVALWGVKGTI